MDKTKYTTPVIQGRNMNPEINYEKQHHIDCVTKFLVDYLLEDKMTIKIYGNQELQKKKKPGSKTTSTTQNITSKPNRPIYGGANNRSDQNSQLPGVNSTMNSSISSQNSNNNYKVQGQTVAQISTKQITSPADNNSHDLMAVNPLMGMKGSYKNQDIKEKKGLFGRITGKKGEPKK